MPHASNASTTSSPMSSFESTESSPKPSTRSSTFNKTPSDALQPRNQLNTDSLENFPSNTLHFFRPTSKQSETPSTSPGPSSNTNGGHSATFASTSQKLMKAKSTQPTIRAKRQRMKLRLVPFEPSLMFKFDPPSSYSESDFDAPDEFSMPNQPHNSSGSDTDTSWPTIRKHQQYLDQQHRELFAIEHNLH